MTTMRGDCPPETKLKVDNQSGVGHFCMNCIPGSMLSYFSEDVIYFIAVTKYKSFRVYGHGGDETERFDDWIYGASSSLQGMRLWIRQYGNDRIIAGKYSFAKVKVTAA